MAELHNALAVLRNRTDLIAAAPDEAEAAVSALWEAIDVLADTIARMAAPTT